MLTKLLQTNNSRALTVARGLLGFLFFLRGAQGFLGWFGGSGIGAPPDSFVHLVSVPTPLFYLAMITEFFGGAALVAGFFTRIAAVGIAVDTVATLILSGMAPALYTDWLIIQGGERAEYYVLAFALALILISQGAGAFSLDRLLFWGRPLLNPDTPKWRPHPPHGAMRRSVGATTGYGVHASTSVALHKYGYLCLCDNLFVAPSFSSALAGLKAGATVNVISARNTSRAR